MRDGKGMELSTINRHTSAEYRFKEEKYLSMKLHTVFALKREKRYEQAERILSELLEACPHNPAVKRGMADLKMKQNRFTDALHLIDGVLHSDPRDVEAMTIKGTIFYKRKQRRRRSGFKGRCGAARVHNFPYTCSSRP